MATHIVNAFSNTCFENNQTITNVDLHNIPFTNNKMSRCFLDCTKLTTVSNINSNVTSLYQTFVNCSNLVNIPVIPNSVTDMGSTFYSCTHVVNAPSIPNSVTAMDGTFYNCTGLVNASKIPNSVTNMNETFAECTNLITVPSIGDSVINMRGSFYNCKSLQSVSKLSNNAQDLSFIFTNCYSLRQLPNIPSSVTNIAFAFQVCLNLTGDIYIHSENITDATNCFAFGGGTPTNKNVYIPFKYSNGAYTKTYNSFIATNYSSSRRWDGVLLMDINPAPKVYKLNVEGYDYTNTEGIVDLTKYTGTSTTVKLPILEEV